MLSLAALKKNDMAYGAAAVFLSAARLDMDFLVLFFKKEDFFLPVRQRACLKP
jgi:hypothetical protein